MGTLRITPLSINGWITVISIKLYRHIHHLSCYDTISYAFFFFSIRNSNAILINSECSIYLHLTAQVEHMQDFVEVLFSMCRFLTFISQYNSPNAFVSIYLIPTTYQNQPYTTTCLIHQCLINYFPHLSPCNNVHLPWSKPFVLNIIHINIKLCLIFGCPLTNRWAIEHFIDNYIFSSGLDWS